MSKESNPHLQALFTTTAQVARVVSGQNQQELEAAIQQFRQALEVFWKHTSRDSRIALMSRICARVQPCNYEAQVNALSQHQKDRFFFQEIEKNAVNLFWLYISSGLMSGDKYSSECSHILMGTPPDGVPNFNQCLVALTLNDMLASILMEVKRI